MKKNSHPGTVHKYLNKILIRRSGIEFYNLINLYLYLKISHRTTQKLFRDIIKKNL